MTEKTQIFRKKKNNADELQEFILDGLRPYFNISALEKYDEATISWLLQEGRKKYTGNGRISRRQMSHIQNFMKDWMRSHYGSQVNVLQRKGRFFFNINRVFKTDQGRLYGIDKIANFLITTHAMDRLEERVPDLYEKPEVASYCDYYKRRWNTQPTIYDIVNMLLTMTDEYGLADDVVFLNIGYGLFVADWYDPLGVITTFLTPKMKIQGADWFFHEDIDLIDPVVFDESEAIDGPEFYDDD